MRLLLPATLAIVMALFQALPSSQSDDRQVTFRIIVVSSEEAAQRVAQQLAGGANFVALAGAQSIDPSARNGGLIGSVALSALRPEMREALQRLEIGQVSPVIRVPLGFAVIQLVPAQPAAAPLRSSELAGLAATGAVRATLSVDGLGEAETALNNFDKPADWNQHPLLICQLRQQSSASVLKSLDAVLSPGNQTLRSASPLDIVEVHVAAANLLAFDGRMAEAIGQFERALRLGEAQVPDAVPQLVEMLGVAHLHKAEMDNGVYHKPGTRCLLPGHAAEPFTQTADSTRATDYF